MYYTVLAMIYAVDINESNFAPARFASLASLINIIFPFVIVIIAFAALAYMLYGAFIWITNGDNPEQIKKAQMTITFSVIGLLIVIFSYLGVKLIGYILNIESSVPL